MRGERLAHAACRALCAALDREHASLIIVKRDTKMADKAILHVHNHEGLPKIYVGARSFMCIGAKPPFDHPHVFLTFGDENEKVCPYCSTLYVYDPTLGPMEARPASAVWHGESVAESA